MLPTRCSVIRLFPSCMMSMSRLLLVTSNTVFVHRQPKNILELLLQVLFSDVVLDAAHDLHDCPVHINKSTKKHNAFPILFSQTLSKTSSKQLTHTSVEQTTYICILLPTLQVENLSRFDRLFQIELAKHISKNIDNCEITHNLITRTFK